MPQDEPMTLLDKQIVRGLDAERRLADLEQQLKQRTTERDYHMRMADRLANLVRHPEVEFERVRLLAIALAEDYADAVGEGGPNSRVRQALALRREPAVSAVTDAMVERALNAWFAGSQSETDQALNHSMRAAIAAAMTSADSAAQ